MRYRTYINSAQAMHQFGLALAQQLQSAMIIYLQGDLGAGKTTLTKAILQGLGVQGNVKSPTYTLVESYDCSLGKAYHFDLYRLSHGEELEYIGMRDYCGQEGISIIEWPEKAEAYLPKADLTCYIKHFDTGRELILAGHTAFAQKLLQCLGKNSNFTWELLRDD